MTQLFPSKSCTTTMPSLYEEEEDDEGYFGDFNSDDDDDDDVDSCNHPVTTPFISPVPNSNSTKNNSQQQFSVLALVATAFRRSLVTCTVENDDDVASEVDIGCPTDVRHVSHVTFDRFHGFLGLPVELQADVTRKPPSASTRVFGVSAQSMQCSYDERGNSVPTILLRMQNRMYSENGLLAEGIFRINPENSQEEQVRDQLNKGIVPSGIDVHCLSGLIKAWFRELPSGVLDCLSPEQVMHCNTEEECSQLVKFLPPTEAALLDWAINLMADVVEHEHHNKMNARNIAMVFAPNMTQMADPLTALIHAVQVMNFLKTLILKTLSQRQESAASILFNDCNGLVEQDTNEMHTSNPTVVFHEQAIDDTSFQSCRSKSDDGEKCESVIDKSNSPVFRKRRTLEHNFRDEYETMESDGLLNRLGLRKGMQKLRKHPVFQLSKTSKKSGGGLDGVVNTNY